MVRVVGKEGALGALGALGAGLELRHRWLERK